jgi:6-phosphogluconolactonase
MEHFFDSRDEASVAAAKFIAVSLARRMQESKEASLVVSGGSTPVACFQKLATMPIEWARVHVLLSDERWISPDDADSNEKLVRDNLLHDAAGAAQLLPVYSEGSTPDARCVDLTKTLQTIPQPFSCTLLGMGGDGHFASLFPDADTLDAGLDLDNPAGFVAVRTAASPYVRISMSLSALCNSDVIILLIFGDDKRAVYRTALNGDSQLPVARLLRQELAAVQVFWAP